MIPASLAPALVDAEGKAVAPRSPTPAPARCSEKALEVINGELPDTIGGSADLTPSNNTKTKDIAEITPGDFSGRYIHYGIREHGMARR